MEKKTTSRFRQFINLPIELVQNRTLIGNLAKNDFKTRFAGSYLGVIWALVKKVVFNIDILPLVKVLSAIFVHVIFTAFTIVLCWCNGYIPSVYLLQIIYYMICNFLLVLGLAYFTSAVVVFFRDLTQIVNIVLQIGMWMTPIMWNISDILVNHPTLAKVFKLNPMYYIVDGFRNALLDHIWFWEKPLWTLAFWIITLLFFVIGVNVFNRLKVHFADVL